jgi:hypothetical protein
LYSFHNAANNLKKKDKSTNNKNSILPHYSERGTCEQMNPEEKCIFQYNYKFPNFLKYIKTAFSVFPSTSYK